MTPLAACARAAVVGARSGVVAVTGASGFIGRRVVARLVADGWPVRALVRRDNHGLVASGIELQQGTLEDQKSLDRLVDGVATVVHCAGAVTAPSGPRYHQVNRDGAVRLAAAVGAAPQPPRLVVLSSLAARAPGLSAYAASKRAGEIATKEMLGGVADVCVVRPPAVYGPGDRATLPIFQQLQRGLLFAPAAGGRFSLLFVDDLAALVAAMLSLKQWPDGDLEPDDGCGGYGWTDLARIAAKRLDRRVRVVPVPRAVAWPFAAIGSAAGLVSGRAPPLSVGKMRELYHRDWVCRGGNACLADRGWRLTTFEEGFAATMAWYRQNAWL